VREREALRDARRDRDGPVDSGRDDPVDPFRAREPLDPGLVLGGHDRPPVRVPEPRRRRVAVDRDHEQVALPRGREQPELRRTGA
jgi:hypothetical protein